MSGVNWVEREGDEIIMSWGLGALLQFLFFGVISLQLEASYNRKPNKVPWMFSHHCTTVG